MAFTSLIFFFIFFPVCLLGYYGVEFIGNKWERVEEYRIKDIILVLFSVGFYGWACLDDIFFLVVYVVFIYFLGRVLEIKAKTEQRTLLFACISVGILAIVLFGYKYMNFTIRIWNRIWGTSQGEFHILAPLGLSFITFSAISYLIDIYRKDAKAGNFLDVALYLTFFPKVISGPIQLWKDFQVQIKRKIPGSEEFVQCLNRILIGMAKKVILADTFGSVVSSVQSNVGYGIDILTALGGHYFICYKFIMIFLVIQILRSDWRECLGYMLKIIFSFLISHSQLQSFGGVGISRWEHGFENMCIFHWEAIERDMYIH